MTAGNRPPIGRSVLCGFPTAAKLIVPGRRVSKTGGCGRWCFFGRRFSDVLRGNVMSYLDRRGGPRTSRSPLRAWLGVTALIMATLVGFVGAGGVTPTRPAEAATADSFVFGTGGDHASGAKASAVMQRVGAENLDFFLSLGDLSYDTIPPAQWCQFVKNNINAGAGKPVGDPYGESYPFELTEGNHDHLNYDQYLPCLPDRMGSTVRSGSTYGRDYYFDYPTATPLARFIVTSPGIEYTFANGSPEATWLSDAIDQARASGIKWVIVTEHKNYVTAGEKPDEIGSAFFNLLVQKKVDLLLQGHEHDYQRSHQLALSAGCPAVPKGGFNASCVVADGGSGTYVAGRGTVLVITGLAGQTARTIRTADPEVPYFAKMEGNALAPTFGFNKISVTADSLTSTFVNSSTTGFADGFTISSGPPPPVTAPDAPGIGVPAAGNGSATVRWSPPATDGGTPITGYSVRAYAGTAATAPVFSTTSAGATATSVPVTGLANGTAYTFDVRAVNAAGTSVASARSIAVTPQGTTRVLTLNPVADTMAKEAAPASTWGSKVSLISDRLETTSPSAVRSYLRFTVPALAAGERITGASLSLNVTNATGNGPALWRTGTFTESTMNWLTKPAHSGTVTVGNFPAMAVGRVRTPVSGVSAGPVNLELLGESDDGMLFDSREAVTVANRPQLIVTISS
jgi:Fibronectin type III domain/Calcineurin-like phosphoesterase